MTESFDSSLAHVSPAKEAPWTDEESAELEMRLYGLLQSQFRSKTQGDSGSMRVEEVAELMASIRFTLFLYLRLQGLPRRALLSKNLPAIFRAAQGIVLQQVEETKSIYQRACREVQPFGSRSLRDTLRGIGGFFSGYDARLYAHQIPGDIDYQLCHPVPDSVQGVTFIREYLNRLLMENQLITRLNPDRVRALLIRACADYRDLLVNLYEPVAACVIGHALLGGGETLLALLPEQGRQIAEQLASCAPAVAKGMLRKAASAACARLDILEPAAIRYLSEASEALYARIVASTTGYIGVFSIG